MPHPAEITGTFTRFVLHEICRSGDRGRVVASREAARAPPPRRLLDDRASTIHPLADGTCAGRQAGRQTEKKTTQRVTHRAPAWPQSCPGLTRTNGGCRAWDRAAVTLAAMGAVKGKALLVAAAALVLGTRRRLLADAAAESWSLCEMRMASVSSSRTHLAGCPRQISSFTMLPAWLRVAVWRTSLSALQWSFTWPPDVMARSERRRCVSPRHTIQWPHCDRFPQCVP